MYDVFRKKNVNKEFARSQEGIGKLKKGLED